jgi:hypothetical protein
MRRRTLRTAGFALLLAGCGNGHESAPATTAPVTDRDGGGTPEAGGGGLPTHDTFETARSLEVGDFPGVLEVVAGREDVDFFSFTGKKGQWVVIRSTVTTSLSISDTAIAVYDPDRQPLASNAYVDSFPGENVYARVVMRLPSDGTYYVTVGDRGAPPMSRGLIQPYKISVVDVSTLEGYSEEVEKGDDAASATPAAFLERDAANTTVDDVFFVGAFASSKDIDTFSFDVAGNERLAAVQIESAGITGDGSTTAVGKAWITDESGATTIARIDNLSGQSSMSPPLSPGKYVLFVSHPDAALAANDFYVVRIVLEPDNPLESADATNGTLETAEPLATETGAQRSSAYVISHVGEKDIDYFRFDAPAGSYVTARCLSAAQGSGLIGLQVALRDDQDKPLAESTEAGLEPASLEATMPDSGKIYLRVTKDSQLADVTGDWARCFVGAQ